MKNNKQLIVFVIIENFEYSKLFSCLESLKKSSFKKILPYFFIKNKNANKNEIKKIINNFFYNPIFVSWKKIFTFINNIVNDKAFEFLTFVNSNDSISVDYFRKLIYLMEKDVINIASSKVIISDNEYKKYLCNSIAFDGIIDRPYELLKKTFFSDINLSLLFNKIYKIDVIRKNINKIKDLNFNSKHWDYLLSILLQYDEKKIYFCESEYYFLSDKNKINFIKNNKDDNPEFIEFIVSYLKNNLNEKEQFNLDNINKLHFYKKIEKWHDCKIMQLKKMINNDNIKIVSFDIFDTLILRPFYSPTDLFELMSFKITNILKTDDTIDFRYIRTFSEKKAREQNSHEVNIDQIYEVMQNEFLFLKPYINKIKEMEIEYELKFCYERKIGKEIFEYSKSLNKKIIFVSDMYLYKSQIISILEKSNYALNDINIYVSSEIKKQKSKCTLYNHVLDLENVKPNSIIHIGDNHHSDIENAKKMNINTFWLPRTIDTFEGKFSFWKNSFFEYINKKNGILNLSEWNKFFWLRSMYALVGNKIFDNPYKFSNNRDFGGNLESIGYFFLGSFVFSVALWIFRDIKKKNINNICFNLRDGFLIKKAFDLIKDKNDLITTNWTNFSRTSLIPFLIIKPINSNLIPYNFSVYNLNSNFLISIFKSYVNNEALEKIKNYLYENKINSQQDFYNFCNFLFINNIGFDKQKFDFEKFKKDYVSQILPNNSAIFDVGYSSRLSIYLKNIFDIKKINEYCLHLVNDKYNKRISQFKLTINKFYDFKPSFVGWIREIMLSKYDNGCIGFKQNGDKFDLIYQKNFMCFLNKYLIDKIQNSSIQMVKDFLYFFGDFIEYINFNNLDFSFPLEYFLTLSNFDDRKYFSLLDFENKFDWNNDNFNFDALEEWNKKYKFWLNTETKNFSSELAFFSQNDFNKMSKIMKLIFLILFKRNILPNVINDYTKKFTILNKILKKIYFSIRKQNE